MKTTGQDDTFHLEKKDEQKELAWLPESLAKKLKRMDDKGEQEKLILKYIADSERDIEYNIEGLEDDVVRYKGAMLKARKAFEDAKNEQLNANYALWEKFDEEIPSVCSKVEILKNTILPLKKELEQIDELMSGIRKYEIEELLKVIEKISTHLSYDGDTGKLLKFLFVHYKKEN